MKIEELRKGDYVLYGDFIRRLPAVVVTINRGFANDKWSIARVVSFAPSEAVSTADSIVTSDEVNGQPVLFHTLKFDKRGRFDVRFPTIDEAIKYAPTFSALEGILNA